MKEAKINSLMLIPQLGQYVLILETIDRLQAGGSTAGGQGIRLAYKIAKQNFIKNGNNRIILASDGDFNIGVSSTGDLTRMIEEKRDEGIFLTVLGFGMGNYKDNRLESLADKGNGNYAYIDNLMEAKKVLVNQLTGTLFTIAKDVKIQVEFNPAKVKEYRLIGYENRILNKEDFEDDLKDAGELGAGHTVTALYEIVMTSSIENETDGNLKYQESHIKEAAYRTDEIMSVKLRYKLPQEDSSKLTGVSIREADYVAFEQASLDFRFASAVTEFGLLLRDSEYKGSSTYSHILKTAKEAKGQDPEGYRADFIRMVELCEMLAEVK